MTNNILPRDITGLPDTAIIALCEEPETAIGLTPLERELVVRLSAALDLSRIIEGELQAEVTRLEIHVAPRVKKTRQTAAKARLDAFVAAL